MSRLTPRRCFALAAAVLVAVVLSGCGSSTSNVVRTPTVPRPSASPSSSSTVASTSSTPAARPTVTVAPSTGLRDKQVVRINAAGFSPSEALQIVQCADKGGSTGPGDCNLSAMLSATSDATGRVSTQLQVQRGPFGANHIVCGAQQRCLVSVTQASLAPTEEADAPIQFAAG